MEDARKSARVHALCREIKSQAKQMNRVNHDISCLREGEEKLSDVLCKVRESGLRQLQDLVLALTDVLTEEAADSGGES